jgi:Bacterial PH domain
MHKELVMVDHSNVLKQLKDLGLNYTFFGHPETKELANVLNPGEQIFHCAFGFYQGGSALLVATNSRLLLVDKRPFFLNLEDIRYEMINEVDFAGRLLDASVSLHTGSKQLRFRSFADARLRKMCNFVQDQITRARQLEHMVEATRPAGTEWRPYSLLLPKPRLSKFSQQQ